MFREHRFHFALHDKLVEHRFHLWGWGWGLGLGLAAGARGLAKRIQKAIGRLGALWGQEQSTGCQDVGLIERDAADWGCEVGLARVLMGGLGAGVEVLGAPPRPRKLKQILLKPNLPEKRRSRPGGSGNY